VPNGFVDQTFVTGLILPSAMVLAPDGRIFATQQNGNIRVVKNGQILPTPFVELNVNSVSERGVLGVEVDPDFENNHYVYVYYTSATPNIHNRVSRFVANGDVAGPEEILLELEDVSFVNHNGGGIHFGTDGKLYVGHGENARAAESQSLASKLGKLLRINSDGSIPSDNPFFNTPGAAKEIWAYGLRNPFTFAVQPGTGKIHINDVGGNLFEEINVSVAGGNYGWPNTEGPTSNPNFIAPLHSYNHDDGSCAISGGTFYNPDVPDLGAAFIDDYFFSDICGGYIKQLDAGTNTVTTFATGIEAPVDLDVDPDDGALYYLSRAGSIGVIRSTPPTAPVATITAPREGLLYTAGRRIRFSGRAIDPDQRRIPNSAFTWDVDFHHNGTIDEFESPQSGIRRGSFLIPNTGETSTNVFYRIQLTVLDETGLWHTAVRDIHPRVSTVTIQGLPTGVGFMLDGSPATTPFSVTSVAGLKRTLEFDLMQTVDGTDYEFRRFAGRRRTLIELVTPSQDRVFTAVYVPAT
jgi:glucose/arabinose dehydrogenase